MEARLLRAGRPPWNDRGNMRGYMVGMMHLLPSGGQGVEHDIRAGKRGEVGTEGELQGGQLLWQPCW